MLDDALIVQDIRCWNTADSVVPRDLARGVSGPLQVRIFAGLDKPLVPLCTPLHIDRQHGQAASSVLLRQLVQDRQLLSTGTSSAGPKAHYNDAPLQVFKGNRTIARLDLKVRSAFACRQRSQLA
jgi:hypothetical protein